MISLTTYSQKYAALPAAPHPPTASVMWSMSAMGWALAASRSSAVMNSSSNILSSTQSRRLCALSG